MKLSMANNIISWPYIWPVTFFPEAIVVPGMPFLFCSTNRSRLLVNQAFEKKNWNPQHRSYCWWFRNPAVQHLRLVYHLFFFIPGGSPDFFHQQYLLGQVLLFFSRVFCASGFLWQAIFLEKPTTTVRSCRVPQTQGNHSRSSRCRSSVCPPSIDRFWGHWFFFHKKGKIQKIYTPLKRFQTTK